MIEQETVLCLPAPRVEQRTVSCFSVFVLAPKHIQNTYLEQITVFY